MVIVNKSKIINKDKIKGIIYGKNFKNIKIEFDNKKFYYEKFKKNLKLNIKFLNNNFKVLIKEVREHPYLKKITHVDFFILNE
ncbi:hypothetical protein ASU29_043 [Candidatus Nasuia deltocephalinicola]|uniref:50S ribosomal protein L25 n=1 Tax=Candidatus Nasuia deltocephalincola TaxID=1160784 RepID=A0A0S2UPD5_9PROT|nr:hypothetical protein ASU29_043 [Candidatus Nasuia deltocephalinicola]